MALTLTTSTIRQTAVSQWQTTSGISVLIGDTSSGYTAEVIPRTQTPSGPALQVQIGPGDVISNIPVTIDFDHHQIHEGESFEYFWQGSVNGTRNFRFNVTTAAATTRTPHMVTEVISDSTVTNLYWYEGIAAWTTAGNDDSARIYNRNRNSTTTSGITVYTSNTLAVNPTTVGGTTNFWQGLLLSAKPSASGAARELTEWCLQSKTEYLFRIITAGASNVLIRWLWYEDKGV